MISGPFFIGGLVGVGCGMMVLGPRSGTPAGTLESMPVCAFRAHVVPLRWAVKSKYYLGEESEEADGPAVEQGPESDPEAGAG